MTLRPQVLVISHAYVVGANRRKLDVLAQSADVTLLVPTHWRDTLRDMPLDPLGQEASYRLYTAGTYFNGRVARFFYEPRDLLRVLRVVRPALVHLEEEPIGLSFLEMALLKRWFKYRLCFFTWENLAHVSTPIERFNLGRADAAIAGNQDAARILRENGYSRAVACIPQLGIDIPSEPGRRGAHSPFRIGFAGRLVPEKGLTVLFEALRRLRADWELFLLGEGPQSEALRHLACEYDFAKRAHFLGVVPHAEVVQRIGEYDVLVLPSLTTPTWKEQFGHVLIEAMAQAVPVIGSNSGAIPEVIGDGGLVVPENAPQALADALEQLIRDDASRVELGHRGYARARARFSNDEIARRTWAVWQPLLTT